MLLCSSAFAADGFTYEEKFTGLSDVWDFGFPGNGAGPIVVTRCGELSHIAMDGTKTSLGNVSQFVECKQQQAGVTGLTIDRDVSGTLYV